MAGKTLVLQSDPCSEGGVPTKAVPPSAAGSVFIPRPRIPVMGAPERPEDNPFPRVVDRWEQVIEDMHATAAEYRETNWDVVALHPGDVTVVDPEDVDPDSSYDLRAGLDVVVPGDEYEELRALIEDRTFDEYELLRAVANEVVFAVVALEAAEDDAAVLVPAYYAVADFTPLAEYDRLHTQVRRLGDHPVVTFTHEDPTPFFPED
jgi:hypothetical protein